MTLDEAIIHAEKVAKEEIVKGNLLGNYSGSFYTGHKDMCEKNAAEHRQLVEWLKLLKEILDSGDCNECGIRKVCNILPKLGELVRYNCPMFVSMEKLK